MTQYFLRRILQMFPVLLTVSAALFIMAAGGLVAAGLLLKFRKGGELVTSRHRGTS